jgi:hypothetical protein
VIVPAVDAVRTANGEEPSLPADYWSSAKCFEGCGGSKDIHARITVDVLCQVPVPGGVTGLSEGEPQARYNLVFALSLVSRKGNEARFFASPETAISGLFTSL